MVKNKKGLHARPASNFVTKAQEFEADITLKRLDQENPKNVNAKSVMGVLAAGITEGTKIEISATGNDSKEAVEALIELLESDLD